MKGFSVERNIPLGWNIFNFQCIIVLVEATEHNIEQRNLATAPHFLLVFVKILHNFKRDMVTFVLIRHL
jgi:hypothetical protein